MGIKMLYLCTVKTTKKHIFKLKLNCKIMEKNNVPNVICADPIEAYIKQHYELKYNLLTQLTEVRAKDSDDVFRVADKRWVNSVVLDMRQQGVDANATEVNQMLCSNRIEDYHPMRFYMDSLPEWDGRDRVTSLAQRVSHELYFVNGFHRWMLGLAAQWMGMEMECANALVPILVSPEQGLGKSTFCHRLMPPCLDFYFSDNFDLGENSHLEQKLGTFGLVNLDEFDRISEKRMPRLKNVLQLKSSTHRKLFTNNFVQMPRMASFIGTSNSTQLLTDPTGSRRFICVLVSHEIDRSPINHAQLYAQLKAELMRGERYWLTHDEEAEVQEHNRAFYRVVPEEEVFLKTFQIPESAEDGVKLTATEIFSRLQVVNPKAMRRSNAQKFTHTLIKLGVPRIHLKTGNYYLVQPRSVA